MLRKFLMRVRNAVTELLLFFYASAWLYEADMSGTPAHPTHLYFSRQPQFCIDRTAAESQLIGIEYRYYGCPDVIGAANTETPTFLLQRR